MVTTLEDIKNGIKKITQSKLTTIINAASLSPGLPGGHTGDVSLGLDGTESEVYIFVSATHSHRISRRPDVLGNTSNDKACYPNASGTLSAASNKRYFYIGVTPITGEAATDLSEAKLNAIPASGNEIIRIENYSDSSVNTVTVKVLRIWR